MNITLSLAISSNPRTWPILDGTVQPDGIDLVPTVLFPSEMFWRQLRYAEFDVSEMSVSSLLMTLSKGDDRWVGLPVFTTNCGRVRPARGLRNDYLGEAGGVEEIAKSLFAVLHHPNRFENEEPEDQDRNHGKDGAEG